MAKTLPDDPRDWWGTREVKTSSQPCGWCHDADSFDWAKHLHQKCVHEIAYFHNLWICPCPCNADWVPVQVEVPRPESSTVRKARPPATPRKPKEPADEAPSEDPE
jgi:hypothetical protein